MDIKKKILMRRSNDVYEVIKFGSLEYSPSQVLKAVDPIAYRLGMNDYEDSMEEE